MWLARRVEVPAHELPIEEARYRRANHMVWAGPRETPLPLKILQRSLTAQLELERFVLEKRPFAAHVTLIRKARAAEALPRLPPVEWPVREFMLVHSSLSSKGSNYEPLERFELPCPREKA
jgi:RNA 2',3'-cyclic 3'-phosphodiesterase